MFLGLLLGTCEPLWVCVVVVYHGFRLLVLGVRLGIVTPVHGSLCSLSTRRRVWIERFPCSRVAMDTSLWLWHLAPRYPLRHQFPSSSIGDEFNCCLPGKNCVLCRLWIFRAIDLIWANSGRLSSDTTHKETEKCMYLSFHRSLALQSNCFF